VSGVQRFDGGVQCPRDDGHVEPQAQVAGEVEELEEATSPEPASSSRKKTQPALARGGHGATPP
jgi:hypothetical protein